MKDSAPTTLIFLRHAPSVPANHLFGHTDVEADCTNVSAVTDTGGLLSGVDAIVTSPARRCLQTIEALWPAGPLRPSVTREPRLWEQNFGDWEGSALNELPDLGPMTGREMAEYCRPGGESFLDVCLRARNALQEMTGSRRGKTICICTHAGPIRAGLALALDGPVEHALRFQIANLSTTVIRRFDRDEWSIDGVNVGSQSTLAGGF